jgi:hypothetical protein
VNRGIVAEQRGPTEPDRAARSLASQSDVLLVGVRVVIAIVLVLVAPARLGVNLLWGDSVRYGEIATSEGRPYRDHAVEYPPVTLAAIEVVAGGHDPHDPGIARNVVVLSLAADLAAAAAIGWGFGARARRRYLLLGLPLVMTGLAYLRLDLLSVALAAGGLALVRRRRPTAGGLVLVAGAFAKLWPAALLPVLAVQRRWRALGISLAAGSAGLAAWIASAGTHGLRQVLTMRGADGWQIESLPGSILLLVEPADAVLDAGAYRIGSSPALLRYGLALAGVAVIAAAWQRAGRRREDVGAAGVVALAALLVSSALLSPQFVLWLLPAVAVLPAAAAFDHTRRVAAVASVLTGLVILVEVPIYERALYAEVILLARNLVLVALVVAAWRAVGAGRETPATAAGLTVAGVAP